MANKSKNAEDKLRTLGTILELVGVPILIIVAILQKISNQDPGVISVLLVAGGLTFFAGLMLHHLPKQSESARAIFLSLGVCRFASYVQRLEDLFLRLSVLLCGLCLDVP
jgi:hypothetical protein